MKLIKDMRVLTGYQNTKSNGEDFAITPFMFLVKSSYKAKVFGLGFCWGHAAFYIGLGFNIPKEYPSFINWNNLNK